MDYEQTLNIMIILSEMYVIAYVLNSNKFTSRIEIPPFPILFLKVAFAE